MAGNPLICPVWQFFDDNGNPLSGGKLYSYLAGTTTPSPLYTTAALSVQLANPAVLDAAGRVQAFMDLLSYKLILKTSAGVTIWTADNIQAIGVVASVLGTFFVFGGDSTSPITAVAYPAGAGVDKLHAGTTVLSIDPANLPAGTYQLEGMLVGNGGTVTAGLVNLSDGSPDVALTGSEIASSSSTGQYQISSTITIPAGGATKAFGIKVKITAGTGWAYGLGLRKVT